MFVIIQLWNCKNMIIVVRGNCLTFNANEPATDITVMLWFHTQHWMDVVKEVVTVNWLLGINTLIHIMAKLGRKEETMSDINHNERLEYLGDAVVEFITT